MALSLTLGGQNIANNDMLIKGIIESIVTVNQFYMMLPFKGIHGNALAYNRELAGVDQMDLVSTLDTGASMINKDAQRFSRHSTELTTIIGDAQVNGLIQAVGSDFNDATAIQVAAKAKGIGRTYMNLLINGNEGIGTRSNTLATGVNTLGVASAVTINNFVEVVSAAAARGGQVFFDAAATTTLDLTLVASWIGTASTGGRSTSAVIAVGGQGFTGPFLSGTPSATSFVLTAVGTSLYNAALRVVNGFLGFDGLMTLSTDDGQVEAATNAGTGDGRLSQLDLLIDRIHDKDGMVDYIMMNSRGVRKYTAALRSVGAAGYDDVMEVKMSSGGVMMVQSYRGVPIFRNDFIGNTGASGATALASVQGGDLTGTAADDIYVGTFDDGTFTHGISGLTASKSAGMQVQKLGARENVDADITRVKWYCGLANFSQLGLLRGTLT